MAITSFSKTSLLRLLSLLALFATTVHCAQVIGIEEATCNPSLPECAAGGTASNVMSSNSTASAVCQDYCATVMGVCTGNFAVYGGLESCLAVCKILPEGQPGDDLVNTVQCRLAQARFASQIPEPSLYCAAAGPGGNDHCGNNCAGLCSIVKGACTGANQQYTAESDCVTACNAVPTLDGGYNVVDRVMSNGNSRQCRLWHASVATLDPRTHCVHAAGASPCK